MDAKDMPSVFGDSPLAAGRAGGPVPRRGVIYGQPTSSLVDWEGWAVSARHARAGKAGELHTARVLDGIARQPGGPTVFHDVNLPVAGLRANVDHVVIAGTKVIVVDAKLWRPGVYVTVAGQTVRWTGRISRVGWADKTSTFAMARDLVQTPAERIAQQAGMCDRPAGPDRLMVVWPSVRSGRLRLGLVRNPEAKVICGSRLPSMIPRRPAVCAAQVAFMARLVTHSRVEGPPTGHAGVNDDPMGL